MHLTSLTRSSQFLFLNRRTHRSLNPCPQKRLHGLSSSQTPGYERGLYASCTIRPVLSVVAWRCVEVAIEDVVMLLLGWVGAQHHGHVGSTVSGSRGAAIQR